MAGAHHGRPGRYVAAIAPVPAAVDIVSGARRLCLGVVCALVVSALLAGTVGASTVAEAARPGRSAKPVETHASRVTVHLGRGEGPAATDLAGVTWNAGDIEVLDPFVPPWVRLGARLDEVSPQKGQIDVAALIAKGKRIRDMGGEPVVTLSKMPAWLARTPPPGCREDRRDVACSTAAMGPTDVEAWESLVHDVVVELARSEASITRFEVWNEPNNTRSWADTEDRFIETAMASHRGVASAAAETGLDLVLGGPATGEVSDLLGRYATAAHSQGTPPGFVSWHHYTRDPADYRFDAEDVLWFMPEGMAEPDLVVSEWNHYGRSDDARVGAVGAAFAMAALIEMEGAGIDRANLYRGVAVGTGSEAAGLITGDGTRRSSWWVLDAWSDLAGERLAVDGSSGSDGLWARATRRENRIDLLVASYDDGGTVDHDVAVTIDGQCEATSATVRRIDDSSAGFDRPEEVALDGLRIRALSPAALWVSIDCGTSTGAPTSAVPSLGAAGSRQPDIDVPDDGGVDVGVALGVAAAAVALLGAGVGLARGRRRARSAPPEPGSSEQS